MEDINAHVLDVKQNLLEKYNFYDKHHRRMSQTQVAVVCRAVCHLHNCDDEQNTFPIQEAHNMGRLDHH